MSDLPDEPLIDELWHQALMDEIEHLLDELEQEILDNANKEDTAE
jgi:hypothetical protein